MSDKQLGRLRKFFYVCAWVGVIVSCGAEGVGFLGLIGFDATMKTAIAGGIFGTLSAGASVFFWGREFDRRLARM